MLSESNDAQLLEILAEISANVAKMAEAVTSLQESLKSPKATDSFKDKLKAAKP